MSETRSVLIVDDEHDIRELLVLTLSRMGLRTDTAPNLATAREMLLEAAVFDATEMKARGFLNTVLPDGTLTPAVLARAQRICALSPQAARLNKQALRATQGTTPVEADGAYRYADSAEHREGIAAFVAKRPAVF